MGFGRFVSEIETQSQLGLYKERRFTIMMAVKFNANAMHIDVEKNKVVLSAAVQTSRGKILDTIDIYFPICFKKHFTALAKKSEVSSQDELTELKEIFLKRQINLN